MHAVSIAHFNSKFVWNEKISKLAESIEISRRPISLRITLFTENSSPCDEIASELDRHGKLLQLQE